MIAESGEVGLAWHADGDAAGDVMWFFFTAVVVWDRPRSAGTWGRGVGTHTVRLVVSEARHQAFSLVMAIISSLNWFRRNSQT